MDDNTTKNITEKVLKIQQINYEKNRINYFIYSNILIYNRLMV